MVSDAQALEDVVGRIVDAIRPWRIVLFGSRARGMAGEEGDYDLYIEVDDTRVPLREIRDNVWSSIAGNALTVDLKVHARGTIEERRDDPGTIEWDVAREGRILYADEKAPTNIVPRRQVGEPSPSIPDSMHEWIEAAERDIATIEAIKANDRLAPTVCGLSHQMCEKYMKALLVSRHVRPERTHKLDVLLAALRQTGVPLPGLDGDCELLAKHAIAPRYPAGNDLGVEDAELASAAAERIVTAVRAELPRSIH
jgi:HEPN domain-containing protein/predicted nucleotidyltransferase